MVAVVFDSPEEVTARSSGKAASSKGAPAPSDTSRDVFTLELNKDGTQKTSTQVNKDGTQKTQARNQVW